ncbi:MULTISPECIES: hypothetical protein [Devosia]|uniref:hypothetical protein n=1 Tax=Devosia TaxID=46913 RepID=UPI0013009ECF|nr:MULTISPECIES: hypothetical protein [Devosia]
MKMTVFLPIFAYVPAMQTGRKWAQFESKRDRSNIEKIVHAVKILEKSSPIIIPFCGPEYQDYTSVIGIYDGINMILEHDTGSKDALVELLDHLNGRKFCILVPDRRSFFDDITNPSLRVGWDWRVKGIQGQVLSIECDNFPLSKVGRMSGKPLYDHLTSNIMESATYLRYWSNGSQSQNSSKKND